MRWTTSRTRWTTDLRGTIGLQPRHVHSGAGSADCSKPIWWTLTRRSLRRVLFGLDEEIKGKLDDRRRAVLEQKLEHASESTLKRREFMLIAAIIAGLGVAVEPAQVDAAAAPGPLGIDISGPWVALWQTTVHREENHNYEEVFIEQSGSTLDVYNDAVSSDNPEGGYLWRAQLALHDDRTVVGAYAAAQQGIGSRGTLFYVLNRSGKFMEGRWVGSNIDLALNTGVCVMARDRATATKRFSQLLVAQSMIYDRSENHG